ncbi:MAG: FAD-dependent oxidoreductase [Burkholderiales bacterium]|nr:FAD-dependent oxidoreductase [Burkholderiales bacterium]
MSLRFDAVVVGAGPAGSAAAILLARAGWSVALVERQRFPRRKVCGECIAASNLPLLDALGVGAEVERLAGAELRRVALLHGSATIVAALPPAETPGRRYGRALGREQLDTLLVAQAQAAGATLFQPCALQAIEGEPGRFRLRLKPAGEGGAETVVEAGLVVAAHGSWEPLPSERAVRREQRRASDLFAFKANFRRTAIEPDLLPVLSFAGGYGGMVVADDGIATLAGCIREDRLGRDREASPGERAGDVFEAILLRECAGVAAALRGAEREGAWLATGPIRPGVRLGQGDGIFRVGNAAGEAHPIVGEGISMALQSAFVLAALLGPQRRPLVAPDSAVAVQARLLREYEALWRQRFAQRLRVAAAFAHLAMRPWAARAAWPVVRAWPGLLTRGARWSGKTCAAPEAVRLAASGG